MSFDDELEISKARLDPKVKQLTNLNIKGELNYFKYLYELFWGGYKRAKLLMPDKSLVRLFVDSKPFEPFGVPGMVSTVTKDDLISRENYVDKCLVCDKEISSGLDFCGQECEDKFNTNKR